MISRVIKKTVDLNAIQKVDQLEGPLYQLEESGHTFEITCMSGGTAAAVSGTVSGRFLRADETTVYFTGTLSGNVASITLPQSCYNVSGRFGFVVFVSGNDVTSAIYAVAGNVYRSTSDTIIDPTGEIPSLEELMAQIEACEEATASAQQAASFVNSIIAPTYSTGVSYAIGAYCTYEGAMYRCTAATSGAFDPDDWDQVLVGGEFERVDGDVDDLKSALSEFEGEISYRETSSNIIPQDFENGYITVSTGNLSDRTNAIRSKNYIPVIGGKSVVLMTNTLLSNCYAVEYDSSMQYYGYKAVKDNTVVSLDEECAFIKMTVSIDAITASNWQTYAQSVGVAYSETQPVAFEEYVNDIKIKPSAIPFSVPVINKIEVGVGKQFTSFVDAINSITDSSENNQYIVYVYEGVYETVIAADIDASYKGLIIPDYVSIIGIGNRDSIVIQGTLPNVSYAEYANNISTINYTMNGNIENITIKSKNLRYGNHDDGSAFGMVRASHKYKRVKFVCEATDSGIVATAYNVGIGAQQDKEVIFEDCLFVNANEEKGAVLMHDNAAASQKNGGRLYVRNCKFNLTTDSASIRLSNSGGSMECYANICENDLYGGIVFTSASSSITTNRWKLFACGNNNYSIVKKSGMIDVDLSPDIIAFNNIP